MPWFKSKPWDIRESAYSHPSISRKCMATKNACSMCLAAVRSYIRCRSCQNYWPLVTACSAVTRQDTPRRNSLNKREIASTSASKAAIGVYIYWMRTCNKRDIHSFLLKYMSFLRVWPKLTVYLISRTNLGKILVYKPGGGGVLPYKEANGDFRWMGSRFDDWIDYNGVSFSIELLQLGRTFSDFLGYDSSSYLRLANVPECLYCRWKVTRFSFNLKNGSIHKNRKWLTWDRENYIFAQKWPRWGLYLATE